MWYSAAFHAVEYNIYLTFFFFFIFIISSGRRRVRARRCTPRTNTDVRLGLWTRRERKNKKKKKKTVETKSRRGAEAADRTIFKLFLTNTNWTGRGLGAAAVARAARRFVDRPSNTRSCTRGVPSVGVYPHARAELVSSVDYFAFSARALGFLGEKNK